VSGAVPPAGPPDEIKAHVEATRKELVTLFAAWLELIAAWPAEREEQDLVVGEAIGLAYKFLHHAASTLTLLRGTDRLARDGRFFDLASVSVLIRAAWEAALLFFHVVGEPKNADERQLRCDVWKYASAIRKQDLKPTEAWQEELLREGREQLLVLKSQIEANPAYWVRTPGERRTLFSRDRWRPSWTAIAGNAGITDRYAKDHYSQLCDRAHSGYLSVLELAEAPTEAEADGYRNIALGTLCLGASLLIESVCKAAPHLDPVRQRNVDACVFAFAHLESARGRDPMAVFTGTPTSPSKA
jgi:hypothetical protein